MSDYKPEVGHKVRATLGENVLVGKVFSTSGYDFTIELPETTWLIDLNGASGWRFERVQELPTKERAIVGHATEGKWYPYILLDGAWRCVTDETVISEEEVLGFMRFNGFTVLFDGVDK